jgi:hypothetical protein
MANKELDLFKVIMPAIDNNIKELYDAASDEGKVTCGILIVM